MSAKRSGRTDESVDKPRREDLSALPLVSLPTRDPMSSMCRLAHSYGRCVVLVRARKTKFLEHLTTKMLSCDIDVMWHWCLLMHSGETRGKYHIMQIWNAEIGFKKSSRYWLWCNIMDTRKQLCEGRCIEVCMKNNLNPSGYDHNSLCNIWIGIILLQLQNWDWVIWYYLT